MVARQQDDIICDKDEAAYTLEATGRPETIKSVTFDEITAGDTRGVGTKIDLTQLTGEPIRVKTNIRPGSKSVVGLPRQLDPGMFPDDRLSASR